MRILETRRGYFHGTHKDADIEIERDPCPGNPNRKFYIRVRWKDGGYLYDGWSPEGVNTMAEAKRDAIKGACLDTPPPQSNAEGIKPIGYCVWITPTKLAACAKSAKGAFPVYAAPVESGK